MVYLGWLVGSKKKLYGPFLWIGFNCLKATEPLWGDSLLFTAKSPEILVFFLWNSEEWNAESTLEPPSGFELITLELGIQQLNH